MIILRKDIIMANMKFVEKRCFDLGILPKSADIEWDDHSYLGGAFTNIYKCTVTYIDGSTSRLEVEVDCRNGRIFYIGPCR